MDTQFEQLLARHMNQQDTILTLQGDLQFRAQEIDRLKAQLHQLKDGNRAALVVSAACSLDPEALVLDLMGSSTEELENLQKHCVIPVAQLFRLALILALKNKASSQTHTAVSTIPSALDSHPEVPCHQQQTKPASTNPAPQPAASPSSAASPSASDSSYDFTPPAHSQRAVSELLEEVAANVRDPRMKQECISAALSCLSPYTVPRSASRAPPHEAPSSSATPFKRLADQLPSTPPPPRSLPRTSACGGSDPNSSAAPPSAPCSTSSLGSNRSFELHAGGAVYSTRQSPRRRSMHKASPGRFQRLVAVLLAVSVAV
jgi:uncharacterized protein YdcH (DUF465 family)